MTDIQSRSTTVKSEYSDWMHYKLPKKLHKQFVIKLNSNKLQN